MNRFVLIFVFGLMVLYGETSSAPTISPAQQLRFWRAKAVLAEAQAEYDAAVADIAKTCGGYATMDAARNLFCAPTPVKEKP